jgi:hypothetical protein
MAYADEYKGNVYENWIVRLYYDAEGSNDWTGVSTDTYSTYHPVITNKPSIRRSIDLAESKAKTGNISFKLINFNYQGNPFSEELLGGSRKYINRKVEVYSRLVNSSLQIYTGRLIDISHDIDSISLSITDKRPSDFVSIPNTKEAIADVWIPVAYGDFSKTTSANLYNEKFLYPAPEVTTSASLDKHFLVGGANTNVNPHYFDKTCNKFFPILDGAGGSEVCNSPIVQNSINYVKINKECYKNIIVKPSMGTEHVPVGIGDPFPNPEDAWKIGDNYDTFPDVNTYYPYEYDYNAGTSYSIVAGERGRLKISTPHDHEAGSDMTITIKQEFYLWNLTSESYQTATSWRLLYGDYDISPIIDICNGSTGGTLGSSNTRAGTITLANWNTITQHALIWYTDNTALNTDGYEWRAKIFDVKISGSTKLDTSNHLANANALKEIKQVYIGGNGLARSWDTGNSATKVHEVHRDLMYRFLGYTEQPENWSSGMDISTEKSSWKVKWWALKPEELQKVLDRLQKEGCFIFLWNTSGGGKYIFVKSSYSASDVSETLDENDISNINISKSPFSELLTKMDISYERHPAEDKYNKKTSFENSTARTNWNIGAKENTKSETLKMVHDTVSGSDSDVTGYWNYYNAIFGDVKIQVKCNIVNPAKMDLDVGDIVQFDLDTKPFGYSWTQYYMITSLTRKIGEMSIECREVG